MFAFALVISGCGPGKAGTDGSTGSDETSGTSSSSGATTGPGVSSGDSTTETTTPTTEAVTTVTTTDETTSGTTTTGETTSGTTSGTTTGATTSTTTGETTTGETTSETTGGECLACNVLLSVDGSNSLLPTPGNTLLGIGTQGDAFVWALDTVGAGRVVYAGSDEVLRKEVTQCGLWEWLADTDVAPRVLSTGNFICDEQPWNGFGKLKNFTYSESMPAKYVGDAAGLRADFDVVVFCVSNFGGPPPIDAQTYIDYVKLQGGGLYLTAARQFDMPAEDILRINEIAEPLGVMFQSDNIDWDAPVKAEFACFPEQKAP